VFLKVFIFLLSKFRSEVYATCIPEDDNYAGCSLSKRGRTNYGCNGLNGCLCIYSYDLYRCSGDANKRDYKFIDSQGGDLNCRNWCLGLYNYPVLNKVSVLIQNPKFKPYPVKF